MFGRTKSAAEAVETPAAETHAAETGSPRAGGKGRPTPKRREAEEANRRPLVGGSSARAAAVPKGATKAERKAAKAARREAIRRDRVETQRALATGDERALPARDKGPVRRFARDYVDSRRWVGESVLPVALVILLAGLFAPPLRVITSILLYVLIVLVLFDVGRIRSQLKREFAARFGDRWSKQDVTYGMMRTLQMRRLRLPKPQVARGDKPR